MSGTGLEVVSASDARAMARREWFIRRCQGLVERARSWRPRPPRMPSPRLRRIFLIGATIFISVVAVLVLLGISLTNARPQWWRSVNAADPRTIALAEEIESAVTRQLSLQRETDTTPSAPGGPQWRSREWSVAISASDANAWLNARLPQWLANRADEIRWPREIAEVQVDFNDGKVAVGARVVASGREQVLSATLVPEIRPDGTLWTSATWLHAGQLPVPASWIIARLLDPARSVLPEEVRDIPEAREMFQAFDGQGPLIATPIVKLGDGRRVRLLKILPRDGRLEITCRTEWK